jgi:hypothetical protein
VGDTVSYDGSCCCKNDCGACLGNVPDSLTLTLHHPDPALDGMSVTITHVAFSQTWFGALTTASNPCGVTGGVTTVIQGRMDCVPGTVGVSFQFTITFKDAGGGLICPMKCPYHDSLPWCYECKRVGRVPADGPSYPPWVVVSEDIPVSAVSRPLCRFLGDYTGEESECETCAGRVRIKLRTCAVYGSCTEAKPLPGTACCVGCVSYKAATEEQ